MAIQFLEKSLFTWHYCILFSVTLQSEKSHTHANGHSRTTHALSSRGPQGPGEVHVERGPSQRCAQSNRGGWLTVAAKQVAACEVIVAHGGCDRIGIARTEQYTIHAPIRACCDRRPFRVLFVGHAHTPQRTLSNALRSRRNFTLARRGP